MTIEAAKDSTDKPDDDPGKRFDSIPERAVDAGSEELTGGNSECELAGSEDMSK